MRVIADTELARSPVCDFHSRLSKGIAPKRRSLSELRRGVTAEALPQRMAAQFLPCWPCQRMPRSPEPVRVACGPHHPGCLPMAVTFERDDLATAREVHLPALVVIQEKLYEVE